MTKEEYGYYLNTHPYTRREIPSEEDLRKLNKMDRPDLAAEQNFLQTLDPALGYPTPEKLVEIQNKWIRDVNFSRV